MKKNIEKCRECILSIKFININYSWILELYILVSRSHLIQDISPKYTMKHVLFTLKETIYFHIYIYIYISFSYWMIGLNQANYLFYALKTVISQIMELWTSRYTESQLICVGLTDIMLIQSIIRRSTKILDESSPVEMVGWRRC